MEDKRGKRWSGRTGEQGSFRAAALLNSSAGVQRGLVCTVNGIFNNPWEGIHTHTENTQKRARTRVHQGWHFPSAPLFPPPGSPSHQRQQDSLPARGNEGSSWTEDPGRREEIRRKKEEGWCWGRQPDTTPHPHITTVCGWNLNSLGLTPLKLQKLGMMANMICLFFPIDQLLTGQIYSLRINNNRAGHMDFIQQHLL